MNKKMIASIFALSAIVVSSANAAITKEACQKSDKTVWVENVKNPDGTKGACVPKNACNSSTFKNQFCNQTFKNIQVASVDDAHLIIKAYVKKQLNWSAGCTQFLDVDVNNLTGQDYIGCLSNNGYKTFEFDDVSEKIPGIAGTGFRHGMCIALNGTYNDNSGRCDGIDAQSCTEINGDYDSAVPTCSFQSETVKKMQAAQNAIDTMSNYQMVLNHTF